MNDPLVKPENRSASVEEEPKRKKPRVTVDDLYRRSSQFQLWSYTSNSLKEVKIEANEKGRTQGLKKFEDIKLKLSKENQQLFNDHENEFTSDKLIELLTLDEETRFLHFYCKSILDTGKFFNMPTQVKATAISFFKKFFLVNSVMEFHPKHILYTVLFLAAKSENYFISIESFCKAIPRVEPKDILDLEFVILQSLKFTLFVHHPFRPLYGFFLDFQAILLYPNPVMYDVSIDTLGSLYDRAKKWLMDYAVLSDVWFLFTPPQIALAAMYDIDKRITDKYLKRKFLADTHNEDEEEEMTKKLDTIEEEDSNKKTKKEKKNKFKTKEEEEAEEEEKKKSQQRADESEKKQEQEKQQRRNQYESLVKVIRKCVKLSKQLPEATREESTIIDKKCFYILNPNKSIKKKIKQLSTNDPNNVVLSI